MPPSNFFGLPALDSTNFLRRHGTSPRSFLNSRATERFLPARASKSRHCQIRSLLGILTQGDGLGRFQPTTQTTLIRKWSFGWDAQRLSSLVFNGLGFRAGD